MDEPIRSPEASQGPVRAARVLAHSLRTRLTPAGVLYVEQERPLPTYPDRITEPLFERAVRTPDRVLYADRVAGGAWRKLTFAETADRVRRLGQFLLDAGLSAQRPLAILSGNDIEHATLALAAIHVGIPYAAISPAYSLVSQDYSRLRDVFSTLSPGMVFAADAARFTPAIDAVGEGVRRLFTRGARDASEAFDTALATEAASGVDEAFGRIGPETVAKFLFTSGSTGLPKAVINTHRMISSNQIMVSEVFAFLKDEPPVLLDWAPWHHTAGGNKLFFLPVFSGGTLYIDDGNPTPTGVEKTVRNLKDVAPTWYFNVPKGFEALVPHLEGDADLRQALFGRLQMLFYAGAGMAQHTWEALERLALETTGERIVLATGLGATETAPATILCTWHQSRPGNVGLPCPGVSLKLVPMDGKLDARVKGPNITPGYWNAPEHTANAFDEEGYYRFGDALRLADPHDVSAGFFFDGRTAENFKLDTGTWVSTGALRTRLIDHFGGLVRDAAIAGADRPYLAALAFPDLEALRRLAGLDASALPDAVFADVRVRQELASRLRSFAEKSTGSSTLVRSVILVDQPASLDTGEMTDKGSINQRAVLTSRSALVEEIYRGSPRVISIGED
ncbi:MAG: feruloyl-CoA synthase [Rhizobiaceae bacterium]|nr:feruloyl-CoA synthase [Rhizobiaceae bacterium]